MLVPLGLLISVGALGQELDVVDVRVAQALPAGMAQDAERLMLQKALADRFHLAAHREQRPMPVFTLTTSKRGPKLKPGKGSDGGTCLFRDDPIECHGMTMAALAKELPGMAPRSIDRPVFDLTRLGGAYDFELAAATIFDALDLVGLRLEERKQSMPVIVIDPVEKPDAN